jgi:GNAT superfamily N-acetyltransferase
MTFVRFVEPDSLRGVTGLDGFILPKKLPRDSFIIAFENPQIQSFIYFSIYSEYIQIIYSFTFSHYRRKGLSMVLREFIINYAKQNGKKRIVSVPFENANSLSLLKRLGFKKSEMDDSYYLDL